MMVSLHLALGIPGQATYIWVMSEQSMEFTKSFMLFGSDRSPSRIASFSYLNRRRIQAGRRVSNVTYMTSVDQQKSGEHPPWMAKANWPTSWPKPAALQASYALSNNRHCSVARSWR